MQMRNVFLIVISLLLMISFSCSKKSRFDADVSSVDANIEIKRLEMDLFTMDPSEIMQKIPDLIEKYGDFFELYSTAVINVGSPYEKLYADNLSVFITDYTMNNVYKETQKVFPDLEGLQKSLNTAFKRYKYFFPDKQVPAVYTYMGGFNQSIVIADSILAIGLDKYLGRNCEYYTRLAFEKYLQQNMYPEKIPSDAIRSWALTEFEYKAESDNLINNLLYHGKLQYILDAVYPEMHDTLKFGFTAEQLLWCQRNEKPMWDYLIEEKLLFSTDYMTINKHINPAPFTSGYPSESPGRASVWLGREIIKAYMDRNPNISLYDLMNESDYQKILSESRYEP